MCVILIGNADKILSHAEKAMDSNPHGAGVAWLDTKNGKRIIRFVKGIDKDEDAKSILTSLGKRQCVFHARIATVGGALPSLTHPFPVEINPDLSLEGKSDLVLFQNGHTTGWEALRGERHDGLAWSDSRAIAHAMAIGTIKNLTDPHVQGSRFVLYAPDFLGYYPKRDWSHIKGSVLASNRDFLNPIRHSYASYDWRDEYNWPYADGESSTSICQAGEIGASERAYYRAKRRARYGKWRGHGTLADYRYESEEREKLRREVKAALYADALADREEKAMRSERGKWVRVPNEGPPMFRYDPLPALPEANLSLNFADKDTDVDDITADYLAGRIRGEDIIGDERGEEEEIPEVDAMTGEPRPEWANYDIRYDCSGQQVEED